MASGASPVGVVIGVDIGGTKVAAGLVDSSGEILRHNRVPMNTESETAALASVTGAIEAVSAQASISSANAQILGIGICSPGPLDPRAGVVINPPNLPCWRNFPLATEISRTHRVPVRVDNDANAAGLAEGLWGAARGFRNVFYATFGTGVGTAVLIGGTIYHGRTGAAAEGGHMSINFEGPECGCGKRGCIEAYAAGPAIALRARAKLESGRSSGMLELAHGKPEQINSFMVAEALASGDPVAREVLSETIELIACWLGNVVDLLEPDVMVVGGGVSSMLNPHLGEIQDRLPRYSLNQRCCEIPLVPARYGEDSGIAGGAALCFASPQ